MCKKLAIIAVIGLIGAAVINKTKAGSYVRTLFHKAEDSISEAIPPELELDRIRHEVGRLDKDIDKAKGKLAKVTVDAKFQREEVEKDRRDLEAIEKHARDRGDELKKGSQDARFKWSGRVLSYDDAKQELQTDVNRVKSLREAVQASEKTLEILDRNRDLLDKQLQALMQQKIEMVAAVKNLEALINLAKLEQIESRNQNDGSRLADIKESLRDLRKRIEVQRERLTVAKRYEPANDASGKSVDEILGELKPASETSATAKVENPH